MCTLRFGSTKTCQSPNGEGGFTPKIVEVIPQAPWVLTKEDKIELQRHIMAMRFLTNYGANLRTTFQKPRPKKLKGMKTHDKHRMLLDILPVALQGLGSPIVHEAIVDLSSLLRWVYMHI